MNVRSSHDKRVAPLCLTRLSLHIMNSHGGDSGAADTFCFLYYSRVWQLLVCKYSTFELANIAINTDGTHSVSLLPTLLPALTWIESRRESDIFICTFIFHPLEDKIDADTLTKSLTSIGLNILLDCASMALATAACRV